MKTHLRLKRRTPPDTDQLPDTLPPLLRRIYATRGIIASSDLDLSLRQLRPVSALGGLDRAVSLLLEAKAKQQRITVVGDFDADGATSSALVVRALRGLGFSHIGYLVPNRFEYGYGLTPEIVSLAAKSKPDLIITVDNGISSVAGVDAAKALGIRVLITDHHLPGLELPAADAIINPNLRDDEFPSKHLAGVGVAFYLMAALTEALRGDLARSFALAELLDLVALGTVADVVSLDHNNRILVAQGIKRIRASRCVPGITALLEVAGRDQWRVSAQDLGFSVAPRLNAAGRLADMSLGIECLLCEDLNAARPMARELDRLNIERRKIEQQMEQEALTHLQALDLDEQRGLPLGLCLFDPAWHQGVVGLLASRVRERTLRPVIAFARGGHGELKGSGRSVEGLHMRDVLEAISTRQPDLLSKFGGHAMAAGLSLDENRFDEFAAAFDEIVSQCLDGQEPGNILLTDGELVAEDFNLDTARLLRDAGPWGQHFPEPVFEGEFELVNRHIVGEKHLKMRVQPTAGGPTCDAIAFNQADVDYEPGATATLAYRLDVNAWQGRESVQLNVIYVD